MSALAGTRLWTNPNSNAVLEYRRLAAAGQQAAAAALQPLVEQPVATWLTGSADNPYAQVRDLTTAAAGRGETAVLVVYNLPERDCGQYSAGGAPDADAYLRWLGSLAAGIEQRPAIVILEPDAIPHAVEGCAGSASAEDRYRLLAQAVDILKRQPGVRLYVDAGNASWIADLDGLAAALHASGLAAADGFSLNVSNVETTADSTDYGHRVAAELGGARFVVDTSRNGAGPPPGTGTGTGTGAQQTWCNPEGSGWASHPAPSRTSLGWTRCCGSSNRVIPTATARLGTRLREPSTCASPANCWPAGRRLTPISMARRACGRCLRAPAGIRWISRACYGFPRYVAGAGRAQSPRPGGGIGRRASLRC